MEGYNRLQNKVIQKKGISYQKMKKNRKKIRVLDLFSGAGGLSRGFLDDGYEITLGVDFDEMAIKTFQHNHGDSQSMLLDLSDHGKISNIVDFFKQKGEKADVLIGGPPCQGFSLAGPRKLTDRRNSLYTAMVKVAKALKPRAFVLENVPGLLQLNGGIGAQRIFDDFSSLGYKIDAKILYAPDYGIPQIRKRVFFVGLLNSKIKFEYPLPCVTKDKYITCEEAIGDLPPLEGIYGEEVQKYETESFSEYQIKMRRGAKKLYNHIGTIHDKKTLKFLAMVPEGKNYKALPKRYEGIYKYHEALTRYHSKKPSLTINTGHRSHFHYKYNRIPTVRESARLQSFPDNFIFFGNKSQQYKQVGNAVPPLLGYHLAQQLRTYL